MCNRQLTFLISRSKRRRAHVRLPARRTVVAPSLPVAAAFEATTRTRTKGLATTARTIDRGAVDKRRTTRETRNGEHSVRSRDTRDERRASPQLGTNLTTASLDRGPSWGLLRLRFTGSIAGIGVAGGALLLLPQRRLLGTPGNGVARGRRLRAIRVRGLEHVAGSF